MSGLVNITSDPNISLEQLEDEVVEERQAVIKEWLYKNFINRKDLMLAINCIPVDCVSYKLYSSRLCRSFKMLSF